MLLASTIGQIAHPFYVAFAWLLAFYYSLVPNYIFAIAMLTVTVMVVVFPITQRGTRSMMRMQLLAPELKKIQARHKTPPGTPTAERTAQRQALNEEMMALYKEHGVSPTGGCLPMFLQFPIFIILYGTIRGLVNKTKSGKPAPLYIGHHTALYHAVLAGHGSLKSFGLNLADSVLTHGISVGARIALVAMIAVAIVLQYIQIKQASGRNPNAAQGNPQMQQMQRMQKIFPIIFAVIYIRIAAGVNVYFIVSSLFRIGQQEYMYRHDPQITQALEKLRSMKKDPDPKVVEAKARLEATKPKGFRARLAEAVGIDPEELNRQKANGGQQARSGSGGRNGSAAAPKAPAAAAAGRRPQARSQGKRPRKPR